MMPSRNYVIEHAEYLTKSAQRMMRRAGAALYLANEGREIPDHLAEAISESMTEVRRDVYEVEKRIAREKAETTAAIAPVLDLLGPFATVYEFSAACGIGWPWSDEQVIHLPMSAGAFRRAALFRREQTK